MLDLAYIFLLVLIVLFIIQLISLLRIRKILIHLKGIMLDLDIQPKNKRYLSHKLAHLRKCEFCKYRQTFIGAAPGNSDDEIYYKCRYHNLNVNLANTCKQFEFDSEK